jgi:hypothetical protein
MKSLLLKIIMVLTFVLVPAMLFAQTYQSSRAGPPIEQPLVREGTLAVKLVDVLKLGTTTDEAQAESLLMSAGIAPRNGWIADYPVTPDIANELRKAVSDAATAKTLAVGKSEALKVFDVTMRDYNLTVKADASGQTANDQSGSAYPDNTVINNYYYNEGPPAVTYYAPPYDYAYLYSWVPYPFWWWNFWFPGFFVLIDFNRVVVVNRTVVIVSNHFFNTTTRTFVTIDPVTRASRTSLVRNNSVIGPSVVRHAPSTVFNTNRTGITTSRSSFANNRTTAASRSGSFTRQTTGNRSFMAPSRNATFRQNTITGTRSFRAPSSGRMARTSFTHATFGRSFGGMRGTFGGRRM